MSSELVCERGGEAEGLSNTYFFSFAKSFKSCFQILWWSIGKYTHPSKNDADQLIPLWIKPTDLR